MRSAIKQVKCIGLRRISVSRAATTLIEVLVVIALVSLLLSIVGTMTVRLRQWDRQMRDHSQWSNHLFQLADLLRSDIRQGTGISQPDQKTITIANADGHEVRYELADSNCRRIVKAGGKTSASVDTYATGAAQIWKLAAATAGRRPAYTLTLERSNPDLTESNSVPFIVYAAVGADRQ